MNICVAQTRPVPGDMAKNISLHLQMIRRALVNHADAIFFPELSLTGYEPKLADNLATSSFDPRLTVFQKSADLHQIVLGVGLPIRIDSEVFISMIVFRPNMKRITYTKQYLHPDEDPFFSRGKGLPEVFESKMIFAPAICYEISVPDHAKKANSNGAGIYLASVAKTQKGVRQAWKRLSEVGRNHSMITFMSNCIGPADGKTCAGGSSVWNNSGVQEGQLNHKNEGLLLYDTESSVLQIEYIMI